MAFLGVLAMGMMASADQPLTMQWVEESVNAVATWGFAASAFLLARRPSAAG